MRTALSWHRPLVIFGLAMVALAPLCAIGMLVDDRVLVGEPIWAKPFKFAVSAALYTIALAWFLSFLRRGRRVGWWAGTIIVAAATIEVPAIIFQVLRGKRSHFNAETPFDANVLSMLGMLIMLVWLMHAVIAVLLLFAKLENKALAWSIRLGLLISMAGLSVGVLMATPKPGEPGPAGTVGGHSVGAVDGGPHLPVVGWNTEVGDLRVPHFIGIHAVQVVPVVIALLGRRASTFLAWVVGVAYAGLFAITFWQAARGQAVLRPDSLTLAAYAALAAATTAAVYLAVRQPQKQVIPA
ncbi:hypothetical protein FKR81_29410 [Lentzea tibetensis]|uniref:Uncharacterized protein n=1 Tax=Lentzea tibetensis TaxID=2591470 RepID=A0A563EM83_9PSEU|nr:hypothetical protein FKR81_29410 [Lentzea tibetensis]